MNEPVAIESAAPVEPTAEKRSARVGLLFVARALALMLLLNGVIFYPYSTRSVPGRMLTAYLEGVASVSGWVISRWDDLARVEGTIIHGRAPLSIVLDCAGLDVQALSVAAIIAFPESLSRRLSGALWVSLALAALNIGRIVALYFAGAYAPDYFHVLHEEVFVVGLVAGACSLFALWIWIGRRSARAAVRHG